jgi:ATP-dependent Lhr-like helicase
MIRIKDLPDKPRCPRCGSQTLGLLKVEEEKALPLIEKKDQKLAQAEEKLKLQALQTSQLIAKYGKAAAVALSARKVQPFEVAGVLEKEPKLTDRFYELVLEVERKTLSKRFR